jgi:hypothetical protein
MTSKDCGPALEPLAERALEVLITHNEAVSRDDLACALRVSTDQAWEIATKLQSLGHAELNEEAATATAISTFPPA